MPRIIIYDDKNIMIAELDHTQKIGKTANIEQENVNLETLHCAYFKKFDIVNSNRIRNNLKKIEKNAKYHKRIEKNGQGIA